MEYTALLGTCLELIAETWQVLRKVLLHSNEVFY